jgi:hypothetical protein
MKVYTVEIDPWGTLGVFTDYEAASDWFDELQGDQELDLKSGKLQEFEVGEQDPQGFLIVRRRDVKAA